MGKASKWFRGLLGLKKPDSNPAPKNSPKKKWVFSMSRKENDSYKPKHGVVSGADQSDVANRKAVAADATAQEVSVVVRHINEGISNSSVSAEGSLRGVFFGRRREEWAAVVIQSHFRAYLSRRALRALKGLVKLQALVRGHLMRKRTADALRQLQALVRAQRRARVGRVLMSESPLSSMKHFSYHEPATPEKFEHVIRAHSMKHEHSKTLKRNGSKSNGIINYDLERSHLSRFRTESRLSERFRESGSFTSDKILEIDTIKPHATPKRRNLFHSSHLSLGSDPNCQSLSPSSGEVQSLSPLNFVQDVDEYTVSSYKRNEFTPTKSDVSRSCLSNYSDNPSYMAYTESSKAKLRSFSAPKQRPSQYERSSSTKRYSVHGQRVSQLQANFANKAYPGSGRLDRVGMPVTGDVVGFSGGLVFHRY